MVTIDVGSVLLDPLSRNSHVPIETDFLKVVTNAKNDFDIENYVEGFLAKKTPQDIGEFNKLCLTQTPSGESLAHFNQLRDKIAPDQSDV